MSYSHYAKDLLCKTKNKHKCCDAALLYGILINANVFSRKKIKFMTENETIADKTENLIESVLKLKLKFAKPVRQLCQLNITDEKIINKFLKKFKYDDLLDNKNLREINKAMFVCDSCKGAFVRGIFIACGTIAEPKNGYHLEISLNSEELAFEIKNLLKDSTDVNIGFRYIKRKNSHILYLKGSETIEDFLYYINATKISFDIMEIKILKELRNNANRVTNLENANLKKTSDASAEQIEAINSIIRSGKFESLPDELKQTAKLRLENIELSLQEIGELSEPKLTKSGVNHRIKKLIEIAGGDL